MSTLIVQLPPREPDLPLSEWQWPELAFALIDQTGHLQRAGRSALTLLPQAASTVLIVAARDVLLLAAAVPPLKGQKLKQALPNIVEDQLIQDPQLCHIAVDPVALPDGRRVLGVIDHAWFRFLIDAFEAAGHRRIRAVPASRCLPGAHAGEPTLPAGATSGDGLPAATPVIAAAYASAAPGALLGAVSSAGPERIELVIARGALGDGLAIPPAAAGATLAALAGDNALESYEIGEPGAEPRLASVTQSNAAHWLPEARPLAFDAYARGALAARFDLCQFEFESNPWRLDRATLDRLRLPALLLAATVAVAVIGINLHWLQLSRQRDEISAQLTETLLTAFPKTTTVLDPAAQMSSQVDRLRIAAGELSPNDFLSLANGLARSLGPIPVDGIAALDYHDRRLDVTFKPGVSVDDGLSGRLAHNGLKGEVDSNTGKWTIRSQS